MNPSKGARRRIVLRLSEPLIAELEAYRAQHGMDGLPAVIEEAWRLRMDRDGLMEEGKSHVKRAMDLLAGMQSRLLESERAVRRWRRAAGQRAVKELARIYAAKGETILLCACGRVVETAGIGDTACGPCRVRLVAALVGASASGPENTGSAP